MNRRRPPLSDLDLPDHAAPRIGAQFVTGIETWNSGRRPS